MMKELIVKIVDNFLVREINNANSVQCLPIIFIKLKSKTSSGHDKLFFSLEIEHIQKENLLFQKLREELESLGVDRLHDIELIGMFAIGKSLSKDMDEYDESWLSLKQAFKNSGKEINTVKEFVELLENPGFIEKYRDVLHEHAPLNCSIIIIDINKQEVETGLYPLNKPSRIDSEGNLVSDVLYKIGTYSKLESLSIEKMLEGGGFIKVLFQICQE